MRRAASRRIAGLGREGVSVDSWSARSGNSRANSPPCGVSTQSGGRAPGALANAVSASASRTVGRAAARTASSSAAARVTPQPGPMHSAIPRRSDASFARASASSTARRISASGGRACSAIAAAGGASVTSPAPTRSAARAASRAAPPAPRPPATISAAPCVVFVAASDCLLAQPGPCAVVGPAPGGPPVEARPQRGHQRRARPRPPWTRNGSNPISATTSCPQIGGHAPAGDPAWGCQRSRSSRRAARARAGRRGPSPA